MARAPFSTICGDPPQEGATSDTARKGYGGGRGGGDYDGDGDDDSDGDDADGGHDDEGAQWRIVMMHVDDTSRSVSMLMSQRDAGLSHGVRRDAVGPSGTVT